MKTIRGAALFCTVFISLGLSSGPSNAVSFPTKLFLSQDGLALSQFPSRQVLTRTIRVDRTQGHTSANWAASSDQSWLTATPSGVAGGKLTVKANTEGLATDQFYSANVTVSTADADFTDSETLHIGLWVGSIDPGDVQINQTDVKVATNPVTPIAYVVAGDGSSIRTYNVYSGNLISTFKNIAPVIGSLEVSSDGGTLFAMDTTNDKIIALDANSGMVLGKYDVGYPSDYAGSNFAYARPYGQPALYIAGSPDGDGSYHGHIIAYPSGEQLATGIYSEANFIAVTPDGKKVFGFPNWLADLTIYGYSVKLNRDKLSLSATFTSRIYSQDGCKDLAVSHDGKRVYPECGYPYEFDVYSGDTGERVQTLPAAPYPDSIEIDSNDNVLGGVSCYDPYQKYSLYVYNPKGFLLQKQKGLCGTLTAGMKVSGDATRTVSPVGGPSVYISSAR